MAPIGVLLVDDDPLVRTGLAFMLGGHDEIEIRGQAANGVEAVAAVAALSVDVVLMDIRMPVCNGIDAARQIHGGPRPPQIIMLTTFADDELVLDALAAGAAGFLVKDTAPADIVTAIHAVAAGDSVLSPAVTRTVLSALHAAHDTSGTARRDLARARLAELSDRELQIAMRIGQGESNATIAAALYLSLPTIKAHVSHILSKTGVNNRVQLAILVHDAEISEGR
ncbi:response regulator [Nocardia beijingensis]|uniref:response regulator n=1 Tax=Nocardia beijingensis TaxID=95162 RepID=UPI000833D4E6|nr:response regulator transcription factor [Nocardia beijingensis]